MYLRTQKLTQDSTVQMEETRRKHGMSAKVLAELVGVSLSTIRRIEDGRPCSRLILDRINLALGTDLKHEQPAPEPLPGIIVSLIGQIDPTRPPTPSMVSQEKIASLKQMINYVQEHGAELSRKHLEAAIVITEVINGI